MVLSLFREKMELTLILFLFLLILRNISVYFVFYVTLCSNKIFKAHHIINRSSPEDKKMDERGYPPTILR